MGPNSVRVTSEEGEEILWLDFVVERFTVLTIICFFSIMMLLSMCIDFSKIIY